MDGTFNKWARGIGAVLQSPEGDIIECAIRLQFSTTNNEGECKAILMGLNLAKEVGVSSVILYSNSQVVIGHINREYETKGKQIKLLRLNFYKS